MARIILGIDPGTSTTGYGILSCEGKKMHLLTYGLIKMGRTELTQPQKLKKIFDRITSLVLEYEPAEVAIEAPFQGKNVQSMLKLGRAQGVAMAAALQKDIPVIEYAPRKVKMSVVGNGNASKEQVVSMLEGLLSFKYEEKLLDAADGIAVAVCHFFQSSSPLGSSTKAKGWGDFLAQNPDRVKK